MASDLAWMARDRRGWRETGVDIGLTVPGGFEPGKVDLDEIGKKGTKWSGGSRFNVI